MYKGTVTFRARLKGNRLTFPLCEVNPKKPGVDKLELENKVGDEIRSTVYLTAVASPEEGAATATMVNTAALNRISFCYDMVIEDGEIIDSGFALLSPPPGHHVVLGTGGITIKGGDMTFGRGVTPATLKTLLEQVSFPGEDKFGLYRSARRSMGPVEEFMQLYHILLMLSGDDQATVDAFVRKKEPTVLLTQHPLKASGVMETVYTRLRNELAHKRAGINLDDTKAGMAKHLGDLIALTKRAIEEHP